MKTEQYSSSGGSSDVHDSARHLFTSTPVSGSTSESYTYQSTGSQGGLQGAVFKGKCCNMKSWDLYACLSVCVQGCVWWVIEQMYSEQQMRNLKRLSSRTNVISLNVSLILKWYICLV